jgi:nucleoside 2-deoxyribosyltransferase
MGLLKVYGAGPFFNPKQLELMKKLEWAFRAHDFFSPRKEGNLAGMTREERAAAAPKLFQSNLDHLEWCDLLFAVIDDHDVGTMVEVGYSIKANKPIVTFSNEGYGLNLMLQGCSRAHIQGIKQAEEVSDALVVYGIKALDQGRFGKAEAVT